MTPSPGVTVTSGTSAPSTAPPTDTGQWFVAGLTEKGPTTKATLIRSLAQFVSVYGPRVSYGLVYDCLETFFKEGGSRAYVGRVVGPAAVIATKDVLDTNSKKVLKATAKSAGTWGNSIKLELTLTTGKLTIVVKNGSAIVEEKTGLESNLEAVTWASTVSQYIDLATNEEGLIAKTQTLELASGTDDRENAGESNWLAATNLFAADLGPGQVSMAGRTTATAQENVLAHAHTNNRLALLDGADTPTAATLTSQALALRAKTTARYGGVFAPWVTIPGVTVGTVRTVPPCALLAGLAARSDSVGGNPNEAIAGVNHQAQYVIGLSQVAWSSTDRSTLSEGGVDVVREINGVIEPYDNVTLVNGLSDNTWLQLSNARLNMAICSRSAAVAERHLFAQIDGRGIEISKFNGDLVGEVLLPLFDNGALFGETPEDAFTCETGDSVNTEQSISEGKLRAVIAVRMSPSAEFVEIEIVKEAI